MNVGEGLNVIRLTHFIGSVTFDLDFTAWQTIEALRTLYICPILMKTCMNNRKLITSSNGQGLNAISQCFKGCLAL